MTAARALTSEISRGYKTKNLSPNHIATAPAYFPIFRNLAESGSHYRSGSYDLRTSTSVEVLLFLESPHTRDFHCVVDPTGEEYTAPHYSTGDPDRYYPRGLGPREALELSDSGFRDSFGS